ncbi:MAG TPA: NAD(P)-dependent oxidoreductase [Nocardioidaceae bacterium]|nr:NAD(P)-dependent oxidoreductase [Nocardioidaceae bacterium]
MKVLLAGAGGAIGLPLTRMLIDGGHEVVGLTRSDRSHDRLRALGARPVAADVLDWESLGPALDGIGADAVVHQLTQLRKPPLFHRSMRGTDRLRDLGTRNLVRAAGLVGARRFVTQSMLFGYGYDDATGKVYTEDDPFAPRGRGRFEEHLAAMRTNERLVLDNSDLEGVALRYGLFYGVGAADDQMVAAIRKRQMPALRNAGPLSWVYLDDAVTATVAAVERGKPGEAYNVVDDEPVSWTALMTELARDLGARPPFALPSWALAATPYIRTVVRGGVCASNAKARRELAWVPEVASYREGVARIAARSSASRAARLEPSSAEHANASSTRPTTSSEPSRSTARPSSSDSVVEK